MVKKERFSTVKKIILTLFSVFIFLNIANVNSNDLSSHLSEDYTSNYNILLITLILLIFYIITYLLYDNKNIEKRVYKRIWNLILVSSFLFTGISGILLSTLSDFNINRDFNFNLIFWHVEFGIIFAITIVFHIHIHFKIIINSFKSILKK
jgi:hypothetical protein